VPSDILTLTLNPALDVLTSIDKVESTHKMRCDHAIEHPGGGGVNVARVLRRLGASCLAAYTAGGVTGERHHQLMLQEKVRCHLLPIANETRESFSVHENSSGEDFRFVLPGPTISDKEVQACFEFVANHLPKKFLVISGGIAPGVPVDFYARLTRLANQHGVPVILDANGPALHAALQEGVFLFKPSLRELGELVGHDLPDTSSWVAACHALIDQKKAQVIALSLGEQGAIVISKDQGWRAEALDVDVQTTIGAGDSFVGGMVWALHKDHDLLHAFQYGMAASAAALLEKGTPLCQASDVHRLLPHVVVHALP
jgi:6-phosphofructokinase 2